MEEKPEGTPNPLNPDLNTADPVRPVEEVQPTESESSVRPFDLIKPVRSTEPKPEPVKEEKPAKEAEPVSVKTKPVQPVKGPKPIDMVRPIDMVKPNPTKTTPQNDVVTETFANEPKPTPPMIDMVQASVPPTPTTPEPVAPESATPEQATPEPVVVPEPESEPLGIVTNLDGTPAEKIDPTSRPMAKAVDPKEEKAKSKKAKKGRKRTKLFVGMMISLFIAIGCGVAAALILLNGPKEDMAAIAMNRLISGNGPENIMIDGDINLKIKTPKSEISNLKVTLGTEAVTKSKINSTTAKLDITLKDGGSFSIDVAEVYAANGDLYLKVNGIKDLPKSVNFLDGSQLDKSILKTIDGEWIRLPINDLKNTLALDKTDNKDLVCVMDLVGEMNNSGNTLSGAYLKNPFVTSTDEEITVTSERDPIYKIIINDQNFRAFANETAETSAVSSLANCLGYRNPNDNIDKLAEAVQKLPDIYVEVDGEANFTRLYVNTDTNDMRIEADFRFSYPDNVNVPEPIDYKDLSEILKK